MFKSLPCARACARNLRKTKLLAQGTCGRNIWLAQWHQSECFRAPTANAATTTANTTRFYKHVVWLCVCKPLTKGSRKARARTSSVNQYFCVLLRMLYVCTSVCMCAKTCLYVCLQARARLAQGSRKARASNSVSHAHHASGHAHRSCWRHCIIRVQRRIVQATSCARTLRKATRARNSLSLTQL